jgi:hypothetical protein
MFDLPLTMSFPGVNQTALGRPLVKLINSLDTQIRQATVKAFEALQNLDSYLTAHCLEQRSSILEEPMSMDLFVDPVARQFLLLRPPEDQVKGESDVLSCLRNAALLYLAEFRRRSGISPVVTSTLISELQESLKAIDDHPALDDIMRLWLLTIGALESSTTVHRHQFCSQIQCLRLDLGLSTTTQYHDYLAQVVWFEPLSKSRLSSLFTLALIGKSFVDSSIRLPIHV